MSMNRASDAAAFDWISTGDLFDLQKAADLIAARLKELTGREEEIAAQTGSVPADASPLVLHDFGFAGMARWLERQGGEQKPQAPIAPASNAKPSISGLDIDSSNMRANSRSTL